jgi:single-strand DNA-binding protein
MNQCILTGNLGADPDIKLSSAGDPIATFNLAFKRGRAAITD